MKCSVYIICPSVLSCSNLKLRQTLEVKNIFKQENKVLQLTFNPGLTLTGFRTTRPRDPVIDKGRSSEFRRKLLAKEHLTLQKVQEVAWSMVAEKKMGAQDSAFPKEESLRVNNVDSSSATKPPKHQKGKKRLGWCYPCGQEGHLRKDRSCPACQSVCPKFRKVGHSSYFIPILQMTTLCVF